jgi:hypothetical protein
MARTLATILGLPLPPTTVSPDPRNTTFIDTSENAVHIQIWTVLIARLLVRYRQLRSSWKWSLSNLLALLRHQLFVYRGLWSWQNQPFPSPVESECPQLSLLPT